MKKTEKKTKMSNKQKKQLDRYSMMIVSKYFKTNWDFIKMVLTCKKFKEIPEMFHYNPVKLKKKTNLFPNIETYHIYDKNEKRIEGYDKYVYWYQVNYGRYLNKKENEEFKNVRFCIEDWKKYDSYDGANILGKISLEKKTIPEIDLTGITKIEERCFNDNRIVKYVRLDKRIATIPDDCFSNCALLVELDLSYVKILGNNCFNGCRSLTALTLPEMLYEIGENCFYGLNNLEKIETKGIKIIESNMNYSLYKSFKTNGIDVKGIISYNTYDRIRYGNEIPEEISIVYSNCFNGITTLGDVILPKSVTRLDYYCFDNCSIKSIDLSNLIQNYCDFNGCNQLTSLTLNKNTLKPSGCINYLFYNKLTTLKNIELSDTNYIPIVSNHLRKLMDEKGYEYDKCIYMKQDCIETNSNIPEEVNIIGEYVFYNENNIQSIIIPSNVRKICFSNFYLVSDLENIEIQSTNIECEYNGFNYLPKIKELDLRGITSFGNNCICNCSSLTKLIIQNIPVENGFINCDSLKEIEIIGIENNQYEHPINYKAAQLLERKGIHCKTKIIYKYEGDENQENYCIPNGINEIASYAFQYCKLKEITIPSSVILIKQYSFYYCINLTHLIIEGNPQIERYSFCGCYQLQQNQPGLKRYS